jgi:hypothetical protein
MRRSGQSFALVSSLALLALGAGPATTGAQSPVPGALEADGERGGRLTVELPPGAAPAGATVQVVALDPSERSDDPQAVPQGWASYALEPADATFNAPVTVRRTLSFEELGLDPFDPLFDGLVLATLFTRAADGTWSWLDDAQVRLDPAGSAFTVTGMTDHGGPILVSVPGDLLVGTEDETPTPVGSTFRVEGQLRVDPASAARIDAVSGSTADEAIATAGQPYAVAGFDGAVGLAYQCLAPGTVTYETTFALSGVGDVGALTDVTGLGGTAVAVLQAGEHTCE